MVKNIKRLVAWLGQEVSVFAFYSDNSSSNPCEVYSFLFI